MQQFIVQNWQFVLIGVGTAIILLLAFFSLSGGPLPYERKGVLLSPAEITFLRALHGAIREDWLIFSMVRLADIIKVRNLASKSRTWQNRIFAKHIDFVICDYETLEVKLAIELDDGLPRTAERVQRDRFVGTALAAAGLPLLRVHTEQKYESSVLRKDLEEAMGIVRKKKRG